VCLSKISVFFGSFVVCLNKDIHCNKTLKSCVWQRTLCPFVHIFSEIVYLSYMKSFLTITPLFGFDFRLCEYAITHTECIQYLEALTVSKLHFSHHADYIFSHAVSLLELSRTVNLSYFYSAEPPILYEGLLIGP
jgi:hypothetical protein